MTVKLTSNFFSNARGIVFEDSASVTWSFNQANNQLSAAATASGPSFANPTAKVGLTAVNGTATTAMRSDAAPSLDVTIAPTWTGSHTFSPSSSSGVPITLNGQSAQIGIFNGTAGNTYFDYKRAGTLIGRVGSADSIVAGGAATDFALSAPGGSLNLSAGSGSTSRMVINGSTGAVTIANTFAINGGTPTSQLGGFGSPSGSVVSGQNGSSTLATTAANLAALLAYLKSIGFIGT